MSVDVIGVEGEETEEIWPVMTDDQDSDSVSADDSTNIEKLH